MALGTGLWEKIDGGARPTGVPRESLGELWPHRVSTLTSWRGCGPYEDAWVTLSFAGGGSVPAMCVQPWSDVWVSVATPDRLDLGPRCFGLGAHGPG